MYLDDDEIMLQNMCAECEVLRTLHLHSVYDMLLYVFITNNTTYSY